MFELELELLTELLELLELLLAAVELELVTLATVDDDEDVSLAAVELLELELSGSSKLSENRLRNLTSVTCTISA